MRIGFIAFVAGVAALCAAPAYAEPAMAISVVNVRAGPGTEFPRVDALRARQSLDVRGCLQDRSWCDIAWRGGRGWVSSRYLNVAVGNGRGDLWNNRSRFRVSTVSWNQDSYWQENYRSRSFYNQRDNYRRYGPRQAQSQHQQQPNGSREQGQQSPPQQGGSQQNQPQRQPENQGPH